MKSLPLDPVRAALVDNINSHRERNERESEPDAIPISKSHRSSFGSIQSKSFREQILKAVNNKNKNVVSIQHILSGNPSASKTQQTENAKEYVGTHYNTAFQLDAIYPQLKSTNSQLLDNLLHQPKYENMKSSFSFNRLSISSNGKILPSLRKSNDEKEFRESSSVGNKQLKKTIQHTMFNFW